MPLYDTQVTCPTVDNDVANFATNTFHFSADDLTALAVVHSQLQVFYNAWRPAMSDLVRQNGWTIKSYDRSDPKPRAPKLETVFNLTTAPTGAPLPPEISLCVSFQGDRTSGVPQSRKRGRIYLPFPNSSQNSTLGRPSNSCVTTAVGAGQTLIDQSQAATTWDWQWVSSVLPGSGFIANGWVDNEWDIQRRRGRRMTSRTTFT